MNELPHERLILGVGCVAAAEVCWIGPKYVQERKAFEVHHNFQNTRYVWRI